MLVNILTAILSLCLFTGDAKVVEDIKLFDVVNLTGVVNETVGYHSNSKAYEFTETTGDLIASETVSTQFAKEAFLVKQFTVKAYLLAAAGKEGGTIVFFSDGKKPGAAFNVVIKWDGNNLGVSSRFNIRTTGADVSCSFKHLTGLDRNQWLHLEVRVHIQERLIRCQIDQNKLFFRYAGKNEANFPFDPFPADGRLRLAQQFLTGDENIPDIKEPFVGKLQDVVISFGDPNCTITIEDNYVPGTTSAPTTCPTATATVRDETCLDAGGKTHQNGEEWKEADWVECSCNKGKTYCIKSAKRCVHKGKEYREGAKWDDHDNKKYCDECECLDGVAKCKSTEKIWQISGCNWKCGNCPDKPKPGCFCPGTKILRNGKCYDQLTCPCVHNGKTYKAGGRRIGCDWCLCKKGNFQCFSVFCSRK